MFRKGGGFAPPPRRRGRHPSVAAGVAAGAAVVGLRGVFLVRNARQVGSVCLEVLRQGVGQACVRERLLGVEAGVAQARKL
jgi:hypothetical protein